MPTGRQAAKDAATVALHRREGGRRRAPMACLGLSGSDANYTPKRVGLAHAGDGVDRP